MKKLLFLTAAALGIASQAFALNPTNSFYVPKKGNFLFRGDASWARTQDTTGTDTYTSIDGMYGLTNGVALTAGVYENPELMNFGRTLVASGPRTQVNAKESRIPEIGVRFVPCLDKGLRLAAEAAYGFGAYGSDSNEHDYIRAKLTGGVDVGKFIFGAFVDYAYYYRFANGSESWQGRIMNIHNAHFYGGGLVATYNVNDKTTIDLTYRHTFKEQLHMRRTDINVAKLIGAKSHYKDAVKLSATYEFKDGAYVTPYVGYNWVDKGVARGDRTEGEFRPFNRNTTTFGVNVAIEF